MLEFIKDVESKRSEVSSFLMRYLNDSFTGNITIKWHRKFARALVGCHISPVLISYFVTALCILCGIYLFCFSHRMNKAAISVLVMFMITIFMMDDMAILMVQEMAIHQQWPTIINFGNHVMFCVLQYMALFESLSCGWLDIGGLLVVSGFFESSIELVTFRFRCNPTVVSFAPRYENTFLNIGLLILCAMNKRVRGFLKPSGTSSTKDTTEQSIKANRWIVVGFYTFKSCAMFILCILVEMANVYLIPLLLAAYILTLCILYTVSIYYNPLIGTVNFYIFTLGTVVNHIALVQDEVISAVAQLYTGIVAWGTVVLLQALLCFGVWHISTEKKKMYLLLITGIICLHTTTRMLFLAAILGGDSMEKFM